MWRFPKIGVAPKHQFSQEFPLHIDHLDLAMGVPPLMDTPNGFQWPCFISMKKLGAETVAAAGTTTSNQTWRFLNHQGSCFNDFGKINGKSLDF